MTPTFLYTAAFAKRFGVHPNTIRLYEVWGYLPPIPRDDNGYRVFDERHVVHMGLARLTLKMPAAGAQIKDSLKQLVWLASGGEHYLAQTHSQKHLRLIEVALARAKVAVQFVEQDAIPSANLFPQLALPLTIRKAAGLIGISIPVLRRWEQYGLISVPQNVGNHYREYGAVELVWLHVIYTLRLVDNTVEACLRLFARREALLPALKSCQKTLARHKKHILKVRDYLDQMPIPEPEY